MLKAINIISFCIPYPPNYGGVIDVYYKLLWLKRAGIKIHLHCFNYGREASDELEKLCEKVYYYNRKTGLLSNLSLLPYTVKSRQSSSLAKNLLSNDFPILFEVLHTCYLLTDERFKHRKKIYRHSNIEHIYYLELSKLERNFLKKLYLKIEAWKLKRFESILNFVDIILAVNQYDVNYFKLTYPKAKTVYLPSFHENEALTIEEGRGDYVLFHGNLSIAENYEAVVWLVTHVFSKINIKVIIAGLKPPAFLLKIVAPYANIQLIASPGEQQMDRLISAAHVHVLYTPQSTGLKLKLLNVLFRGRFIICNTNMISGTILSANETVLIADTPEKYIHHIRNCFEKEFAKEYLSGRTQLVSPFINPLNAQQLITDVFSE